MLANSALLCLAAWAAFGAGDAAEAPAVKEASTGVKDGLEDFRVYPVFDANLKMHAETQRLLSETSDALDVLFFVEVDAVPLVALNYIEQQAARRGAARDWAGDVVDTKQPFVVSTGYDEASQRRSLAVVLLLDGRPSNVTHHAFSSFAVSARRIVLSWPRTELEQAQAAVVKALLLQADLTSRTLQAPTAKAADDGAVAAADHEGRSDGGFGSRRLPPLDVVVPTGCGAKTGEATALAGVRVSAEEMAAVGGAGAADALQPLGLEFCESAQVRSFAMDWFSGSQNRSAAAGTFWCDAQDSSRLTSFFDGLAAPAAEPRAASAALQNGPHLVSWLAFVRGNLAPARLAPAYPTSFVEFVSAKAVELAVERYQAETAGALSKGWAVTTEGGTARSLPASAADAAAADEKTRALVTREVALDAEGPRPPSPGELEALSRSAGDRAERFSHRYLQGVGDAGAVAAAVRARVKAAFAEEREANDRSIAEYVARFVERVGRVHATKLRSSLKKRIPFKGADADAELKARVEGARADVKQILGSLWDTRHGEEGMQTISAKLRSDRAAQDESNDRAFAESFAEALAQAEVEADAVARKVDLPVPYADLKARLDDAAKAGRRVFERRVRVFLGAASAKEGAAPAELRDFVWAERLPQAEKVAAALQKSVHRVAQERDSKNKELIRDACRRKSAASVAHFKRQFVRPSTAGGDISFPVPEETAFETSSLGAVGQLDSFNETLLKYSGYNVFSQEYNSLIEQLQILICSDKEPSVMSENVAAFARQSCYVSAFTEVEKMIRSRQQNSQETQLGSIVRRSLEKHCGSAWNSISAGLKKRVIDHWCGMTSGITTCAGNCVVWDTNSFVHMLDVLGLCESNWCSWLGARSPAEDTTFVVAKSERGPFEQCPVPKDDPCPTYWDRKNLSFIKHFLRAVSVVVNIIAIIFIVQVVWRKVTGAPEPTEA